MITISIKIGTKGSITYQGTDAKKVFMFSAIFGALPSVCDACQSSDIFLNHKSIPGKQEVFLITCKKCNAESLVPQRKSDGGFFYPRDNKMVVYNPNTSETAPRANQPDEKPAESESRQKEIPF